MTKKEVLRQIKDLANCLPRRLYVVGGFVRDRIIGRAPYDIDVAGDMAPRTVIDCLTERGYRVSTTSKKLMTLRIDDDGVFYEYTAFRTDSYDRGHTPTKVERTSDIAVDARRRDFTMNAVYYDPVDMRYVDPLGGIEDIKNRTVRMTKETTFSEDGLRLMRLCRQAAELGFSIEERTLAAAKENAFRIKEIAPERVKDELNRILTSDTRYGVVDAPFKGMRYLDEIGVLDIVLPELTLGKGMAQRPIHHKYDVFHHMLYTMQYSDPSIRLPALLHDIGKPYCKLTYGNYGQHPKEGCRIAEEILTRLRYSKKEIKETCLLIKTHMFDIKLEEKEDSVRSFLQRNYQILDRLFLLKHADFLGSAVLPGEGPPAVERHKKILAQMMEEGVPFSIKDLLVDGRDLERLEVPQTNRSKLLYRLFVARGTRRDLDTREAQLKYLEENKYDVE